MQLTTILLCTFPQNASFADVFIIILYAASSLDITLEFGE